MTPALNDRKPKLVFFQWDHQPNAGAAGYLLLHMQQHVKCLSTHFDVVVVNQDCDYAEICDLHEPDMVLFESGYRSHGSRRPKISNTHSHLHIPRAGLHNADPWCDRRSGLLSDMELLGIETCFSISTLMADYTPELADNLFIWPNCVDTEIYHDYHQHKTIPVTLTGQVYGLYPWRQQVFKLIQDHYPCLVSPQHGYDSKLASRLLSGESYARALNASFIVPTCGTAGGEVVRKHFEIPAAKACLVTERTDTLEAAGFVDMENCVFADHRDVLDRLHYLFSNPDQMRRVTESGYAMVHSRHTLRHRPQIHQWFMLQGGLADDEKIVQLGPFGDLTRVARRSGRDTIHAVGAGPDRASLREADRLLHLGRIEEARAAYSRSLDFVSYLPEAKFGLAMCALNAGCAAAASRQLIDLIEVSMVHYGAADPDPVEWASLLLALIAAGRPDHARRLQDFYPRLAHPELRRVRGLIRRLAPRRADGKEPDGSARNRRSVHVLPSRTEAEWLDWFAAVLDRGGQQGLALRLRRSADAPPEPRRALGVHAPRIGRAPLYAGLDRLVVALGFARHRPNIPPMPEFGYLRHLIRGLRRALFRGRLRPVKAWLASIQERGHLMRRGSPKHPGRLSFNRSTTARRPEFLDSRR